MAQYPEAFEYLMTWEDAGKQCAIVPDVGGEAISGINSHSWPQQYAVIAAMPQGERLSAVSNFYLTNFWNPSRAGGIDSQDVANRVLDQAVNGGLYSATKMLQSVVNGLGASLTVDGVLGALSLEAVNAIDPERLLAAYRAARVAHYQAIAAAKPELEQYLAQWETRANA